ncbi:MAG: hypothetical protein FWC67_00680 [Defluviitaleaceae bacterium]|nr:hypothetical protein [Defluviitaleaceae bacterium]
MASYGSGNILFGYIISALIVIIFSARAFSPKIRSDHLKFHINFGIASFFASNFVRVFVTSVIPYHYIAAHPIVGLVMPTWILIHMLVIAIVSYAKTKSFKNVEIYIAAAVLVYTIGVWIVFAATYADALVERIYFLENFKETYYNQWFVP